MRIAVYGGTFDPPHFGHLAVARAAVAHFALDRVLLAPTGLQPLKAAAPLAPFEDRCAMVNLLCKGDPHFTLSREDAPRPDGQPNYSIDLLTTLRTTLPATDELFAIVGADAFQHFAQWRSPQELLHVAQWIVVSRPGIDVDATIDDVLHTLGASDKRHAVHALRDIEEPASATEVRHRLAHGLPCDRLVPPSVLGYIREHGIQERGLYTPLQ
jgi:nicotinate-nucleotide adenylyltransferase